MTKKLTPAKVQQSAIVIDTHADTPLRLADEGFDFSGPLSGGNFDLAPARQGNLAAQFFAIWAEPEAYKGHYARRTLVLIDALKQQIALHHGQMVFAASPADLLRAHRAHKLAALMGIEGGHAIEDSLALLRQYYDLGARYMTLTWANSNGWADSSGDADDPSVPHTKNGLSDFGVQVVQEMNRLGMMVDISHVSDATFYRTLAVSRAPVLASHSCARALCRSPRNMTDDMLRAVARSGGPGSGGGVIQVNFFSAFVSEAYRGAQIAQKPEVDSAVQALKDRFKAKGKPVPQGALGKLRRRYADRIPRPPISDVVDHIDHIARVAGVQHVGLGSDFDGVDNQLPAGLNSPADLPKITAALIARGYSPEDCRNILGGNLLRLFRRVQTIAKQL